MKTKRNVGVAFYWDVNYDEFHNHRLTTESLKFIDQWDPSTHERTQTTCNGVDIMLVPEIHFTSEKHKYFKV